eukprot:scaffold1947_cov207-Prasinococcus_capsulatus_cf.AAC.31
MSKHTAATREKLETVTEKTSLPSNVVGPEEVAVENGAWQGPAMATRQSIEQAAREAMKFGEENNFSEDELVEAVTLAAMTAAANRPFAVTASGALVAREVFAGRKAMQELVEVRLEAESLKASVAASKAALRKLWMLQGSQGSSQGGSRKDSMGSVSHSPPHSEDSYKTRTYKMRVNSKNLSPSVATESSESNQVYNATS